MVHYEKARILAIENVDLPMHVLGVQAPALVGCIFSFLVMIPINPLYSVIALIFNASVARYFFLKEITGQLVTFSPSFLKLAEQFPFLSNLFPSLHGIIFPKGLYHGS